MSQSEIKDYLAVRILNTGSSFYNIGKISCSESISLSSTGDETLARFASLCGRN